MSFDFRRREVGLAGRREERKIHETGQDGFVGEEVRLTSPGRAVFRVSRIISRDIKRKWNGFHSV